MSAILLSLAAASCLSEPIKDQDFSLIGEARYKKAMFTLYDAGLCAKGDVFDIEQSFALTLNYRRSFTGALITKAGIIEMARLSGQEQEDFAALRLQLESCFPDVKKGDTIIGVSEGPTQARFYYNGQATCEIEWPEFREHFFGIWLGEQSREPRKAKILKGLEVDTK